jgi:DNA-directed RNA polymerase specialized sigma24 family protein
MAASRAAPGATGTSSSARASGALIAQLPHLYALANALDANAADDLVQETLTCALADPDTDTTASG